MKIYTKTGDLGETSLLGGQRVPKDALRIEAYGTVDELNSALGIARALKPSADVDQILGLIQSDLFTLGADLAASGEKRSAMIQPVGHEHVARLEQTIDTLDAQLPPLTTFIIPGGSPLAAQLHLARTICRRAERLVVRLSKAEKVDPLSTMFLNRLSDTLFVVARYANHVAGVREIPWVSSKKT
ncbi:MAG TPA: cob(I)yrinic acid a,c-diamide adenosyltransferase [Bacteroidetes bacterium]|nr:MAG: ATP:cob(I)alamin adenosyltransferase [Ignavibacteria bacterium GWA2_54_16]HCA80238.1 cob(I)yrinic acid a,c-diamide adenosyltransferase [Bacteroidota bacterium]